MTLMVRDNPLPRQAPLRPRLSPSVTASLQTHILPPCPISDHIARRKRPRFCSTQIDGSARREGMKKGD